MSQKWPTGGTEGPSMGKRSFRLLERFKLFAAIQGAVEHFARTDLFALESSPKVVVLLLDTAFPAASKRHRAF